MPSELSLRNISLAPNCPFDKKKQQNKTFLAAPAATGDLTSPTRIKPAPPAMEVRSLKEWTAREVPYIHLLLSHTVKPFSSS